MTIQVDKYSQGCGATITGVDLNNLSNSDMSALHDQFAEHGVIFFRDQQLTPEQHIAFAQRWGKININRFFPVVEGYPQIARVFKDKTDKVNIGGAWHTDHSYDVEPAMGSLLYAREIPETGGNTLFANMYAAYEGLSEGLKKTLEAMQAVHSAAHIFGTKGVESTNKEAEGTYSNADAADALGEVLHPVVITHPLSGRKSLYVNPGFTLRFDGWSHEESAVLLAYLYQHAAKEEYTCNFKWQVGSLAMWDNRATWHNALNDYHGQRRELHRITIEGCALSAA